MEKESFNPTSAFEAALARRKQIMKRSEQMYVPFIAPEDDHRKSVKSIGNQLLDIVTETGQGKLPVTASHSLMQTHPGVTQIYVVQHGITRNGPEYYQWFRDSLGANFDRKKTAIIALQFPASIDPIDDTILRWGFHDWKSAEPASEPSPPISAAAAKDAVMLQIPEIFPDSQVLELRNNSAGAQQDERYIPFSKALKHLERERGITIEAINANPGSVLYFHPLRPTIQANGDIEWIPVPEDSPANRWPYGMHDTPPYVDDYLTVWSLDVAIQDYLRRTRLAVGELDNNPNASQLQNDIGAAMQGRTRYERVSFKQQYLQKYAPQYGSEFPEDRLIVVNKVGHNAKDIFKALSRIR